MVSPQRRPGTMRERSPGHWQLRAFAGTDTNGRPQQVSRTFVGGERQAAKALAALITQVEAGSFDRTRATVGELLDTWLDHIERLGRRPSTLGGYRAKIDHAIRPVLGDIRITKLKADDLDSQYRRWTELGLAPATVRQYHSILSAALRQAERWGWIDRSPAARATAPPVRQHRMKVPTPSQLNTLYQAAKDTDPVLATAVALAAMTGMRRGELVALRWSDVDLVDGFVRVARGITLVNGVIHEGPIKTHQVRRVALDDVAVSLLSDRWDDMRALSEMAESPLVEDPFVLSYQAHGGLPISPDGLTHRFSLLCRAQEVPARNVAKEEGRNIRESDRWHFRFHDLRHFSVTTLIAAGVDIQTVSERHGHSQATVTLNRYAHALPERDREAAGVLGRAFGG